MIGQGGRFQQQNIEKRRTMSVREWAELCAHEELRAPGVNDIGVRARATATATTAAAAKRTTRRTRKTAGPSASGGMGARMSETAEPEHIKREHEDESVPLEHEHPAPSLVSPPNSHRTLSPADNEEVVREAPVTGQPSPGPSKPSQARHPLAEEEEEEEDGDGADEGGKRGDEDEEMEDVKDVKRKRGRGRRAPQTREARVAEQAARAEKDREFLDSFDPRTAWLPPSTDAASYTTEFCKELERVYWRNCGWGKAPWYGADMQGKW